MILVGDILRGYCSGLFGRDHYGDWRVEAIGADWVVVRRDGEVDFAYGKNVLELLWMFCLRNPERDKNNDPEED